MKGNKTEKLLSTLVVGVVTLSLAQTSSTMPFAGPALRLSDKRAEPGNLQHFGENGAFVFAKLVPSLARASQSGQLSLADRAAYQRAIEEVYWRHRIWPKENAGPKPSLDEIMSPAQLEKKVEDYLRNSQALDEYWQHPVSANQIQVEMERMAQHTQQPEVLHELFAALGNDPFVIAECLARPTLSERLLTDFHALDQNGEEPLESWRARMRNQMPKIMAAPAADYTFPSISETVNAFTENNPIAIGIINAPKRTLGCIDTWSATNTTNAPAYRGGHTAVWTGSEMIVWGGDFTTSFTNTGGKYNPATDSWTATSITNAPTARESHTAVWTGSEMIVWGGGDTTSNSVNTGGKYNPGTDSWIATGTTNAPADRQQHTAVWTGSEMIVWGGTNNDGYLATGGRYNPVNDTWTGTSTTNTPSGRVHYTAVWTGSEMIVWGGSSGGGSLNTGGRYNLVNDTWTVTSIANAPAARVQHTAVWTGNEMIAWGGYDIGIFNTGGRYNPGNDSWTATSITDAPTGREFHTAVWTGSEMIVWGGVANGGVVDTGGRYDPGTDGWTATNIANAPEARAGHTAVWSGSEMIVWGGFIYHNTGGRYCAQATPIPTPTPTPTPASTSTPTPLPAQTLNIATRMRVDTGSNVLIAGFIITGSAPKNVVIRGIGPSLAAFGIGDVLADPTLELHGNGSLIAHDDDWQDDPAQASLIAAANLALPDPKESGIAATLQPGSYSAILAGKNGGTGVGLVEVYDTDSVANSQLANISTRGFVLTGANVMIGGFILGGDNNAGVVVRGIGPSLAQFGLSPVMADPTLELHDSNGAVLVSNDNWQDDPTSASELTALGLAPSDPKESGIYRSLPPGAFTAILAGADGGTGIGLVEVYNVR